jgi:hypothetical protein
MNALMIRFNIDKNMWNQAISTWERQDPKGFGTLISNCEYEQVLWLRSKNGPVLNFTKAKKIIEYKLERLREVNSDDLGLDLGSDHGSKYHIVETYMFDEVNKKYQIEEEDL